MQKIILIVILSVLGIGKEAVGQHFVTSFGISTHWRIPDHVYDIVYYDYYDYDWVHANRVITHGHTFFDVILQRGNIFLEVRIGKLGHIHRTRYFDYYPLASHVCGGHCGFHEYYYQTYYSGCDSHHHHGHNHVIYRPRPVTYVYGSYRHHHKYNGHYKSHKYKGHKNDNHYRYESNDHHRDHDRQYNSRATRLERPGRLHDKRQSGRVGRTHDDHHNRNGRVSEDHNGRNDNRSSHRGDSDYRSKGKGKSEMSRGRGQGNSDIHRGRGQGKSEINRGRGQGNSEYNRGRGKSEDKGKKDYHTRGERSRGTRGID